MENKTTIRDWQNAERVHETKTEALTKASILSKCQDLMDTMVDQGTPNDIKITEIYYEIQEIIENLTEDEWKIKRH